MEELEQSVGDSSADHENSIVSDVLDPGTSPSSSIITSELDGFLKEINDASASFLQTLHIKSRISSDTSDANSDTNDDVGGEFGGEEFPALSTLLDMVPQQDLEDFLHTPISSSEIPSKFRYLMKNDEDDDMDAEWSRLGAAEENLRKELDLASCGFGLLGLSPDRSSNQNRLSSYSETTFHSPYHVEHYLPKRGPAKSLLDDDVDSQASEEQESAQEPYSKQEQTPKAQDEADDEETSGDSYVFVQEAKDSPHSATSAINPRTYAFHTSASITEQACYIGLHRLPADLGAYSCPIFRPSVYYNEIQHALLPTEECTVFRQHFYREYVTSITSRGLRKLFIGLTDPTRKGPQMALDTDQQEAQGQDNANSDENSLYQSAVRTCTIRVRPDVLCGSIMDAVACIISDMHGEILKRQGGHLRAIFPSVYKSMKSLSFRVSSLKGSRMQVQNEMRLLPPWIMDAQICSRKRSKDCERMLLVRAFPVPPWLQREIPPTPLSFETGDAEVDQNRGLFGDDKTDESESSVSCVWDAAQILHDMILDRDIGDGFVTVDKAGEVIVATEAIGSTAGAPASYVAQHPDQFQSASATSSASKVARKIGHFLASPIHLIGGGKGNAKQSVARALSNHGVFPSLSHDDAPIVESAWDFIKQCIEELESRDLGYSSLGSCSFGLFPALSTIDNHYCTQLRLLVRESMVVSLLKTASELENFARDAEYSCANLVQLLKPTFAAYGIEPPELPRPVPLSAYPLDFIPPEIAFPPWGQKVMEALSVISSASSVSPTDGAAWKSGFEHAGKAVSSVVAAFQRQDDEEQSARLGRKNMQVMDRLAKMQEHKRASILAISNSYESNPASTKAANEFHAKAEHVVPTYDDVNAMPQQLFQAIDQVPLFQCGMFLGGATGTCFVTAHQLLCTTQFIPLVGGNRYHLFNIRDIALVVQESPPHSLIQLPPGLSVRKVAETSSGSFLEDEVLRFIPSIDAQRFKDFVDAVRDVDTQPSDSLRFSSRGGLLYMHDDHQGRADDTTFLAHHGNSM